MADTLPGKSPAKAVDEPSTLTLKEAHALLAAARPAAVLSLLKNPDFAMIAGIAFMGFRVDARSYANPLVRRRLAEEAVRNSDLARELRNLAAEARTAPAPPPKTTPVAPPPKPAAP